MVKTCPRRNGKRSLPMYSFVLAILLSFLAIAVILSNHVTHADRVADARVTNGIDDNASDRARIGEAFAKLPLSFEADQGKAAKGARFLSRGGESSVFVTSTEMVLALRKSESRSHVLRMKLAGASPNASGSGTNELPGKVNYITGSDPHRWRTDIPTYATVKYENVYPGIDVVYYGNQRQLEYDFRLRPGADPRRIRLAFDGAQHLSISEQGDLVLGTGGGDIVLKKPTIYQEIDGEKHDISGSYLLHGRHGVGFEVGDYDRAKPLVIDPTLVTLKVFGGSGDDRGRGIAVDSSGNAYITGNTTSTDFPTTSPFQGAFGGGTGSGDDFVVKLNPQGTVAYSTYLGGSGNDQGNGIAVDSLGNAYITGTTSSTNFPRANALQNTFGGGTSDAFVTELNATGSALIYSTYLGGSGADTANGIALDSSNNVYITGFTSSINFPTRNALQGSLGTGGSQNAFVTKLNAAGSALVYSTYLGGNSSDTGSGIALDSANNAYVAGFSYSSNFPTMNPFQSTLKGFPNAFVSKLNPAGSALVYSTYLAAAVMTEHMALQLMLREMRMLQARLPRTIFQLRMHIKLILKVFYRTRSLPRSIQRAVP